MSMAELVGETHERDEPNAWWTTLKHQGVLLSPIVLEEMFPQGPPGFEEGEYEQLRRSYKKFQTNPDDYLYSWLDTVFEDLLEYPAQRWEKETHVSPEFTHSDLRPNRVLLEEESEGDEETEYNARALVWIDDDRVTTGDGEPGQIGIYSGKREHAKLVKLLRATGVPLGILTNGHQFRLIHTTLDQESWTQWDAWAWFEGGEGRTALQGFAGLLSDDVLPSPVEDEEQSLIGRIQASRDRQADLSDVMGTQVREAVELLLQELDDVLMQVDEETREEILEPLRELDLSRRDRLRARYQASIRIVMRLVVALYAESRELFPKENPIYFDSYSVEGLFRNLREARIEEGEDTLEQQYGAWPQIQALTRLVYFGSPHSEIPMPAYGGRLFRPPEESGADDVLAALEAFEHDEVKISDAAMLEVLERLKIAEFRSGGETRTGPVDFSDLRTEYIGMMYEGLLDYDLREATEEDGAIIFLNIGDQPALPFHVLENLDKDGMEKLVDNLKGNASGDFLADEEASEEDLKEEDDEEEVGEDEFGDQFTDDIERRVHQWAKEVVEETRVYMPHFNTVRAMDPTVRDRVENEAAKKLVDRIIRPGGTYLVSWSGTRKSTGTFYTPPGLAVPTVHRTLKPLAYNEQEGGTQVPKQPEEILELKVCDPAMGSGTFPVAALNYLTQALKDSFEYHVFPEIDEGDPIAAPLGDLAKGYLNESLLQIRKDEGEDWEDKLEIQLKRAVVERCIYGVDINPLAVELGKLSLWIETLDPDLPFTFLDHKLRVGNSLIGAWLDEFEHYPVAAWNREGGDGRSGKRTKRIKKFRNNGLKKQMRNYIKNSQYETRWFETGPKTRDLIENARQTFNEMHESVDEGERERLYQEEFRENDDIKTLRHLMDRWCAVWFWPMDSDDQPLLDPETFYNTVYDGETDEIVRSLSNNQKLNFFHWELEFPDVFSGSHMGFHAVIGNPPWETEKPEEIEFFTRYRPEFRTYGKRESKKIKERLFEQQSHIEQEWHRHVEYYRGFSNYVKNASNPWDVPLARGKKSTKLKKQWAKIRQDSNNTNPYQYQGSADLNTYKLFSERSHFIARDNGWIGLIIPAGIYADYGTQDLRRLYMEDNRLEWVYSFTNRKKIFDIDSKFTFCSLIGEKGGETKDIKCAFMIETLEEWNQSQTPNHLTVTRDQISKFSPDVRGLMEVESQRDIDILDSVYDSSNLIGDLEIDYVREFDMSLDSDKFKPRQEFVESGYENNGNGEWCNQDGETALTFYQGRMINQFDSAYSAYNDDNGWEQLHHSEKNPLPKYLMKQEVYESSENRASGLKVAYRRISPATNQRTLISSLIPSFPAGDSVFILDIGDENINELTLVGILNSYVFDFVARYKLNGFNLSWYIMKELPLPDNSDYYDEIARHTAQLIWHSNFFPSISDHSNMSDRDVNYESNDKDRAKLREKIDELVAKSYGLSKEDMRWILRPNNSDPRNLWTDYEERVELLGTKAKWVAKEDDHDKESVGEETT
ncbi:Eco57I restriction-modification methylase domain-containing protein [Natrialbaceae archaeon A-CW2]